MAELKWGGGGGGFVPLSNIRLKQIMESNLVNIYGNPKYLPKYIFCFLTSTESKAVASYQFTIMSTF